MYRSSEPKPASESGGKISALVPKLNRNRKTYAGNLTLIRKVVNTI